ncbi:MAG: UvrD-helicase domain-containing protein [Candidatus Woesearchaeota archaeon]
MGDMDYVLVLKAIQEIPFGVGKNLLIDFLQGQEKNESVARNRLNKLESFGSLAYSKEEVGMMIDNLALNGLVTYAPVQGNPFWKVLELTPKGRNETENPTLYKRKLSFGLKQAKTFVTEQEKEIFSHFGEFLSKFNDEQKKAVISNQKHLLCIAGAGSGKTAVLTRRIEFLVKYRSVDPQKILAITFTRKARQEMQKRLEADVAVETFNSFCEKLLRQHNDLAYGKLVHVVSYRDRMLMIAKALSKLKLTMRAAIDTYFSPMQQRGKTDEQLANIFMNDCFFIRDYFKSKNKAIQMESFDVDSSNRESVKLVFGICSFIEDYMAQQGLRDFADQLLDAIALFEKHPEIMPKFEHILIDEYQDVNSTQIRLVDLLNALSVFAVGDPRQSIYGWRGSDVRHMLSFQDKYPDCEIITLAKNYRSTKHIVNLINNSIKGMGLADLDFTVDGEKDVHLMKHESEAAEFEFVMQHILNSKLPRQEIFVLARTNRQLVELSELMKKRGILHIVRSDEIRKTVVASEGEVTLATIHAIKGLEAELVFVIGCTGINFPCRGSEHPVIDMVKVEEYDKEEEEKRLFYVAMSRAKKSLYLTYSGKKYTAFITDAMMEMIEEKKVVVKAQSNDLVARLKEWRRDTSRLLGVPAYVVLHDKTIIELAQQMPQTKEDLESIPGLGPMKIVKYGEDILDIIGGC